MSVETVKAIIESEPNLAFIIGNGINKYQNNPTSADWQKILLDFWNNLSTNQLQSGDLDGISLTELFDILSLQTVDSNEARDEFVNRVNSIAHTDYHDKLQRRLIDINRPVLTTNFDTLLETGLKLRRLETSRKFTAFYPWENYWGRNKLSSPVEGFGIWHVNGMTKYKQSIKLGLSQYTLMAARAKDLLLSRGSSIYTYDGSAGSTWRGINTWFHIIFTCDLLIFGLNLGKEETFMRWLLIERAKFFDKNTGCRRKGWYVCKIDEMTPGKKLFLESVGFQVIELNDYDEIYSEMLTIS